MLIAAVGGAGFVGRHLARCLHEAGHDSISLDRRPVTSPLGGERGAVVDLLDARGPEEAARACGSVDAVVWLAASIRQRTGIDESTADDLLLMVEAPLRFLRALERPPVSFVYLSSIQVYGRPLRLPVDEAHPADPFTSYGVAKLCAEKYLGVACAASGIPLACLRLGFVYGPGQHPANAIPRFLDGLRRGEAPVVRGDGRGIRDDIYAGDVAEAILEAILRRASGAINIATGRPHTLMDVAEAACRVAGGGLAPVRDPADSGWVDRWYDVGAARRLLGFEARTPLDEGLRRMWEAGEAVP